FVEIEVGNATIVSWEVDNQPVAYCISNRAGACATWRDRQSRVNAFANDCARFLCRARKCRFFRLDLINGGVGREENPGQPIGANIATGLLQSPQRRIRHEALW